MGFDVPSKEGGSFVSNAELALCLPTAEQVVDGDVVPAGQDDCREQAAEGGHEHVGLGVEGVALHSQPFGAGFGC